MSKLKHNNQTQTTTITLYNKTNGTTITLTKVHYKEPLISIDVLNIIPTTNDKVINKIQQDILLSKSTIQPLLPKLIQLTK